MTPSNPSSPAAGRAAPAWRLAVLALSLGVAATGALAQAYKIVGPDGKVTYTDKPPAAQDIQAPAPGSPVPAGATGLPYETRQAMAKYPVTLYTTTSCGACDAARQAMRTRGVPFNEFSISTDADFAAFQGRFNTNSFPVVTVGNQAVKGYSSLDLSGYLDAAGYPAQARLTGYRWPSAQPLTAPANPATTNARAAASTPPPAPAAPAPTPANPSGIQF